MNQERKKTLREQYASRKPVMGVVCWQAGDKVWACLTRDAAAEYNSCSFQLKMGSWPNRELQHLYSENPETLEWKVMKQLEYEDPSEDHSEDLDLLLMEFLEEYPQAQPMSPRKKWK